MVIRYLRDLSPPRIVRWCYLIWYLVVLVLYFEPSALLWLNSLGISAIIGTGLVLSTAYAGRSRTTLDRWQTFRLYLMPFCVSSFAALIKGRGFVLVFHPTLFGNAVALGSVAGFVSLALAARAAGRREPSLASSGFSKPAVRSGPRSAGGPMPAERGRTSSS